MLISYNLLQKFLNFPIEIKHLSHILTSVGLEVENTYPYKNIKSNLDLCVVGEIIQIDSHPDADKLKITHVNVGNNEILKIVCGANNVALNKKVMVAKVGATLTNIDNEKMVIQKAKIRGQESFGMLCSEKEIGLSNEHEGIKLLEQDAIVGMPLEKHFNLYSDTVFEIGLTPNRMDAMSHFGVARDVAAYINYHQKQNLTIALEKIPNHPTKNVSPIQVSIENKVQCKRYCGIYIQNVKIQDSPIWLQNFLKALNIKSINNIVDITNYILHSFGQPLHAFDADKISKQSIVVTNLEEKTPFIALDNSEKKLLRKDLVICDGEKKPLCLAGIFGGMNSGISQNTKNVFLEAAVFDAVSIRTSSFYHQLRTEAAQKFEKGIDASNTLHVLKIATALILELANGRIVGDYIDILSNPFEKRTVKCSYPFINKLSGKAYQKNEVDKILNSLQFEMTPLANDEFLLKIPFHKLDIENENDIVEEIMRIDGLDNIPIPTSVLLQMPTQEKPSLEIKEKTRQWLIGNGVNEIFTNSITNPDYFNEEQQLNAIKIINSINKNLNILSPHTLPNGLDAIRHNLNRKQNDLQFFEFNKKYVIKNNEYIENSVLSLWLTGQKNIKTWQTSKKEFNLYDLKEIINLLLEKWGIQKNCINKNLEEDLLENGFTIYYQNKKIISYGYVKQSLSSKFEMTNPILFAEFNWDELSLIFNVQKNKPFTEIPKFPSVKRDLSILLNKKIPFSEIENQITNLSIPTLNKFMVFDYFENEKLGNDKKAIAITFEFLDVQKTLTDQEIETLMNSLQEQICTNLAAEIRSI